VELRVLVRPRYTVMLTCIRCLQAWPLETEDFRTVLIAHRFTCIGTRKLTL
jgi:hypothetical protein